MPGIDHLLAKSRQYFFQFRPDGEAAPRGFQDANTPAIFACAPPVGLADSPVVSGPLALEAVGTALAARPSATYRRADVEEDGKIRLQGRLHPFLQHPDLFPIHAAAARLIGI